MKSKTDHNKKEGKTGDHRLEFIQELIIQLASGNLGYRSLTSKENDDYDAIITGINMLGEELQTSTVHRDYLNGILEGIMDMMVIMDPGFHIEKVNESLTSALGYSNKEAQGLPLQKLLGLNNTEYKRLIKSFNHHNKLKHYETNLVPKKGKPVEVTVNFSKLKGKSGEDTGVLMVAREIGHLKKVEADLKRSNLELNTFIYKLSHDIRGPLSSIIGLTDLAGKEMSPDVQNFTQKDAVYFMRLIQQSATKLDRILMNLTEVINLRNREYSKSTIPIKGLVEEIATDLIPKNSGFKVRCDIDENLTFKSDQRFLFLIFSHLIDNAFKFKDKRKDESHCDVAVSHMKSFLLIKVKDNGKGISKDHVDAVFTMFHRASADSTGSGLGLFIVKSVVDRLEGEIQIFSTLRKGTEIMIFLPN